MSLRGLPVGVASLSKPFKRSDRPDKPANQLCQWFYVSAPFSDNPDSVHELKSLSGLSGLSEIF